MPGNAAANLGLSMLQIAASSTDVPLKSEKLLDAFLAAKFDLVGSLRISLFQRPQAPGIAIHVAHVAIFRIHIRVAAIDILIYSCSDKRAESGGLFYRNSCRLMPV